MIQILFLTHAIIEKVLLWLLIKSMKSRPQGFPKHMPITSFNEKEIIRRHTTWSWYPHVLGLLGIRRGLVVMMPGSQAWVCRFESPLDPQAGWPGCHINVRRCEGLSMVRLQLKTPWNYSWRVGNFFPVPGFYLVTIWPKLLKAT